MKKYWLENKIVSFQTYRTDLNEIEGLLQNKS